MPFSQDTPRQNALGMSNRLATDKHKDLPDSWAWRATQIPGWEQKKRTRRANALARISRKKNRIK